MRPYKHGSNGPYNCNSKDSPADVAKVFLAPSKGCHPKKIKSGVLPSTKCQDELQICQLSNMTLLCLWRGRVCGLEDAT